MRRHRALSRLLLLLPALLVPACRSTSAPRDVEGPVPPGQAAGPAPAPDAAPAADPAATVRLEAGWSSRHFLPNPAASRIVLQDCYVLLHGSTLSGAEPLVPLLKKVARTGRPLLVVAGDIEESALALLVGLARRGTLPCCAVRAPGDGDRRRAALAEIAALIGGRVIGGDDGPRLEDLDPAQLGRATTAVIEKDHATIAAGAARPAPSAVEGPAPSPSTRPASRGSLRVNSVEGPAPSAVEGPALSVVEGPVSYFRDVVPILKANCVGCHCPAKKEGKLLMTTFRAFQKGGKDGPAFVPDHPEKSRVVKMISGEKPEMPKDADPLRPDEVALIGRWIREGARNDTPPAPPPLSLANPPVYSVPPVISALAWSPDGTLLAVSGYHEVLLHRFKAQAEAGGPAAVPVAVPSPAAGACACKAGCRCAHCGSGGKNACPCGKPATSPAPGAAGAPAPSAVEGPAPVQASAKKNETPAAEAPTLAARLIGESPRIESLAFSPDGRRLAVGGAFPTEFGQIQVWDVAALALEKSHKVSADALYGVSFSPDATQLAFGCADKSARVIAVDDGRELMKFDSHTDWVLGTAFTVNGKRLLTGCRDRAMKLINLENGQLIDDINKLLEPVLCIARHPTQDVVAYGGALGTPRVYKISDNQGRTAANNDTNLMREFERQPGPVRAVAWSPDGGTIAVGGIGPEVRLYAVGDGRRIAALTGHAGAVFALAFHPDGKRLCAGGFDGAVRVYDVSSGALLASFIPVPLAPVKQ